ncbi:MAG TPA: transporter substrate-binding domain-containing protein [Bacillales bacterium]|nr:transporter substrate-binding domain-containing protein [Bacillales bacterium]
MRKPFLLFGALFLMVGMLTACGTSNGANAGNKQSASHTSNDQKVLTIGTEGVYKPFSFKDLETGKLTGYDVEVAREVAKRIGMKPVFKPTPWKSMFASLNTKRFDMIANEVSVTPERKKKYAFSIPYTYSGGRVIVNKDNTTIHGLKDLKGKVVGTTKGSNYAKIAQQAGAKVKYYKGIEEALKDLSLNRIDAALNDRLFILTQLKKSNEPLKAVGPVFDKTEMAFTFREQGSEALIKKVNNALKEMKKDGSLAKISKKWFGENVSER